MGQRVVWTTEMSHGVQTGPGGNAGRPIHLPAGTQMAYKGHVTNEIVSIKSDSSSRMVKFCVCFVSPTVQTRTNEIKQKQSL